MINYKLTKTKPSKSEDFVIFSLGNEEYAIDVLKVLEICRYENIATIANMPSHIKGIKKLADKMALILDLRLLFNIQPINYDDHTIIIVIKLAERLLGLIVSEVKEVLAIPATDFRFENDFQALVHNYFIQKVARVNERLFFIIDIEKLYNHEILHLVEQ